MNGVHLIIFCDQRYKDVFLDNCVYCIEQNVQDRILTKTIVSPSFFPYPGFDVIDDQTLWHQIDADLSYDFLFNIPWLRQQVLKMSVDCFRTGDLLIVDADLFFIRPVRFLENSGYNIYTAQDWSQPLFDTTDMLLDHTSHVKESYVTDFAIWNSTILKELRLQIEHVAQSSWLDCLTRTADPAAYNISEYQLYGSYLQACYDSRINRVIAPVGYKKDLAEHHMDLSQRGQSWLHSLQQQSDNHYQSVLLDRVFMAFREFYLKVKDPSWPDCDDERSWLTLPDHIKKECVEQHEILKYIPSLRACVES
jgi:hypothetical protein